MKLRNLFLSSAACLVLSTGAIAASVELVQNGGFETGDFSFWTGAFSITSVSNGNPNSGTFSFLGGCIGAACVNLTGTGVVGTPGTVSGNAFIEQTLNLNPGIYRLNYAYDPAGGAGTQFAASFDGLVVENTVNGPNTGYSGRSFVLANTGGNATLQFGLRQDPGFSFLDDISVVQVDDGRGNDIGAAALAVAAEGSRSFLNTIFGRFASPGTGTQDMAATPQETQVAGPGGAGSATYRAWLSGRYGKTEWDDSDTEAEAQGVNLGFDFDAGHGWTLGVAGTVATVDFSTSTAFTSNRGYADELMAAIYAQWAPESSPFYAMGAVGYGIDTSDVFRDSLFGFGGVGATNIDTTQWFGALEAGMNWAIGGSTMLTPYARVEGGQIDQDGYAETNLSGIFVPAVVADAEADVLRTLLGARLSTGFHFLGAKWRALGHVAWQHEFETDRNVGFIETAGFGTSFAGVAGAGTPAEDAVAFGAGLDVQVTQTVNLFVKYDGISGDGQDSHTGQAGVRITW